MREFSWFMIIGMVTWMIGYCVGQEPVKASTAMPLRPMYLRCEYRTDPIGIEVAWPRLSWQLESEQRGQGQTAYQILVASNLESLTQDTGDLWDSSRVQSDETMAIVYAGPPLISRQDCFLEGAGLG